MERICKALLVSLFIVVICIPATGWLAGWHLDAHLEEKRELAPWPTMRDLRKDAAGAAKAFETAFSDRFAVRNTLIKADAWLNWRVFGITTTKNVVVGRDGWLFFTGDRSMPLFQGIDRYTDVDAAYVADALEMRHDWLRDQGIASAHVIAPAKESVYPEFMPRGIPRVKRPSCMEEFITFGAMSKQRGLPLDLLSVLTKEKEIKPPLYLRGDSHWNDEGALIAYREILRRLGFVQAGLSDAALLSSVDPRIHPYHDLATMLGITETYCRDWPNDSPVIKPLGGWTFQQTADPSQRMRQTTSTAPLIDQPVLMFGDSFSEALLPFMAQTFSTVALYQGRYFSPTKVREHNPKVVIMESAERLFFHNRPAAAEEARVIHSPAWRNRFTDAGGNRRTLFDSKATGWDETTARPKQAVKGIGPLRLRTSQNRVSLMVPVDVSDAPAASALVAQLHLELPSDGVLKWQYESGKGDAPAPSWLVHVELAKGANDVFFGLPSKGSSICDRLNLSIQTNSGGEISIAALQVVALTKAN